MQMPLLPAGLAIAALLAACTDYQAHEAHERRLTIAPDPVPCADGTPGSCLRVTDADGDSWITHPEEIQGFTYEPGFAYELLVEEASQVAEMEAAAPPRLKLIRVVSKEQSGELGRALDDDLGGHRWVLTAVEPSGHGAHPNGPLARSARSSTSGAAACPAMPAATITPQRWRCPATRCRCPRLPPPERPARQRP